jgi:hypothetical protein
VCASGMNEGSEGVAKVHERMLVLFTCHTRAIGKFKRGSVNTSVKAMKTAMDAA